MGTLGSASIKLNLDRSQFDSDLKKLQATDAGAIAYRIKLDTKDFEQQIKGLRIQSPIFIPLEIDTKTFDQQIKKLSTSIDPIKVDLAPNVKDFQEKLRRLSKISPIAVDIKVDEAKVRQQFEQVGKYAAEGFTQGFSGVEGAGKSAVDSMVKSVNKQLGIQSPSKVFRDIGKFAIAGLMQGLDSVDESKLKGVTNKIESYFKKSKIKVSIDADTGDFNPLKNVTLVGFDEKITTAIESGFKNSRPKPPSTFSKIFSGIGNTLLAPLQGITTGAFQGVGLQLSQQLGLGLSRGIESQLSPVIGSFELLGEKLITGVAPKLGSTVGGKIAGAILNSAPLQNLKNELASQITSIVGESEKLIANNAQKQQGKQRTSQQQKLAQKELAGQLQIALVNAPQKQQQAQKIKQELLPTYQQEVKTRTSQVNSLQADREMLVAAGTETEEIKQAIEEIDAQMAQALSALVEAKKSEQLIQKEIAALLGEASGVVGKLKIAGADVSSVEGIDFALKESTGKGQEIIARLDGNIKIQQANLKEAGSRLKLYKQQQVQLKQDAIAALQSGDEATAKQLITDSKKSGIRANAAQQEVGAYKGNISEILKIRLEAIKGFAEERGKLKGQLESQSQILADSLVAPDASPEIAPARARVKSRVKKRTGIAKPQSIQEAENAPTPVAAAPPPQIFQDIVSQVAALTQIKIAPNQIPQLVRGPEKAGFSGKYNSVDNAVTLPAANYDDLTKGVVSPDTIKTLVHELRHAMQTDFGKKQITQSAKPGFELVKATAPEQQKLGSKIQASTDFFKKGAFGATPQDVEVVKTLEEDAYVFAERYFEQVFHGIMSSLQSGIKTGGAPTEAELLKQVNATQAEITANLKQSFKGAPRDRKVTNKELAGNTLTSIDEQIAFVSEQLKRTDLSPETRKKLGSHKGTIERQYRTYSPALRQLQSSQLPSGATSGVKSSQGVSAGFELFAVNDPEIESELARLKKAMSRRNKIASGAANPDQEIKRMNQLIKKLESLMPQFDEYQNQLLRQITQKIESQSIDVDEALKQMRSLARKAEKQARKNLRSIQKNALTSTKKAEAALKQLEENTNAQVTEIESGIEFNQASQERKTRRILKRIQRGYGGDIDNPTIETEAPRLERPIKEPETKPLFGSLGKEFKLARLSALTKQAQMLDQQASILLADVNAQIALGKAQEKESQIIQKQIQQNERRLNALLNQIKRAQSGKDPKLTPGDVERLSGKAVELTGRIDADKQRLATVQAGVANGKELQPVAEKLKNASAGAKGAVGQQNIQELEKYNAQLRENLKLLGEEPPNNVFDETLSGIDKVRKVLPNLGTLFKGFLAFQGGMLVQNFLSNIAQEAFKAFVELDRLKTALNFASGGKAGGAQNLAFVRKTVDDLKIPLKASTEGFVQLAAAAKGSALEGRETRETFLGISQASTVLSLSADQTQGAILALSQMISKGKVSSEELRQQLGERLPGAMGIAARSMGLTEQEFTRLLDAGQILSQDFLPKFAKQLQSEFGDAAKDASGNAQSAIFDVQNAFLGLQQGIGEGVSPAAIAGLSGLSTILKGLASVSKELGFILLGVTAALAVKMVGALQAVIAQLIATKLATGTLGGGMQALGQTINNSFSVKLTAGIFAVLEIINLLNQAINTELVSSFDKAAKAATRAAEASAKAFQKPTNNENKTSEPIASSGAGRFFDNFLIKPLNYLDEISPIKGVKLDTYGKLEQSNINKSTNETTNSNTDFLISARTRLNQLKSGSGDIGQLPAIDATLKDAEQQRQILQADINRKFVAKGIATPVEDKRRLEAQNLRITDLNNQRSQIAKPFTLDLSRTEQQINGIKSQIESLKSPEGIAAVGGDESALQLIEQLKNSMEKLKKFKAEAENTLASLRIDPVLAFTQSLRGLNLALAEGQEKNDQNFNSRREAIATNQITGFSTNKLATRDASLQNAIAERDRNRNNVIEQEKAINSQDTAINSPEFQTTLKRLGVTPDSTLAKIDDVLKNTQDEADKGILEKLKSAKELRNKLPESRTALAESQVKVQQQVQDNSLFDIEDRAATVRSKIQKSENQQIASIRNAQNSRFITEEQASEKISRIQLLSTQRQKKTTDAQLQVLREYYAQGAVSAEEFAKRERDLTTEQTSLEKQEAENRLAVQQAVLGRRLKDIEFVNRKAEAMSATSQSNSTRTAKEKLLSSGLTPQAQDQFSLEQAGIDGTSASSRVNLIKDKISQNKQLFKEGLRNARDFANEQYTLNQELAQANLAVVDQKIAAEEKYREVIERNIGRIMALEDSRFKSVASQLEYQKAGLDLYNQSLERTGKLEESRFNLSKALSDAAVAPLETKKDNASRALELSRKLKDDNLDPSVRNEVNSQLNTLGFGTKELDILAKRSQIEDEIAAKKLEALKLEQEYQKKSLQLDLQRQKITTETAVYDAQSTQLSAAKSKLEAEAALRIAKIKKDPEAIAIAQTGIEIANREVDLSDKRLGNALKNLEAQDEFASNITKAQEVTQKMAVDQQLAADGTRKQTDSLEKVEAKVAKTSTDAGSSVQDSNKRPRNRIGETYNYKGRTIKDGVDVTNYQYDESLNRAQGIELPKRLELNQLPSFKLKPGENLFDGYMNYRDSMPSLDKTSLAVEATKVLPNPSDRTTQFANALKTANIDVVQRLDKLIDSMSAVACTPRSLTVQTPNPVDDAAKLMNDLSRGQVVGAGL